MVHNGRNDCASQEPPCLTAVEPVSHDVNCHRTPTEVEVDRAAGAISHVQHGVRGLPDARLGRQLESELE